MSRKSNSLLFLAVADACGVPYEFPKTTTIHESDTVYPKYTRRLGGRYLPTNYEFSGGVYSDDTQLMLATARSLRHVDWLRNYMCIELPAFLSYQQGAGDATGKSCKALIKNVFPWAELYTNGFYDFGGNGVTVRTLPHVFDVNDINQLMCDVTLNGITTHGSPVALLGARLYTYLAYALYNDAVKPDTMSILSLLSSEKAVQVWSSKNCNGYIEDNQYWKSFTNYFPNVEEYWKCWDSNTEYIVNKLTSYNNHETDTLDYKVILDGIGCYGTYKGSGIAAALCACILCGRYFNNPVGVLKEVCTAVGTDTDSIGAALGGIVGLVSDPLPTEYYTGLVDCEYIRRTAESIGDTKYSLEYNMNMFVKPHKIKDAIKSCSVGDSFTCLPFGLVTVVDKVYNESLSDKHMCYTNICSSNGQTLRANFYPKM